MKTMTLWVAILAAAIAGIPAGAAEADASAPEGNNGARLYGLSASADLASSYVFRGRTLNDGMVLQPEAAVRLWWLSVGVWANIDVDDYQEAVDAFGVSETRVYVDCEARVKRLRLGARYTRYLDRLTHAGNLRNRLLNGGGAPQELTVMEEFLTAAGEPTELAGEPDVEDAEVSVWLAIDGKVSPSVIVYRGIDGAIDEETYVEGGLTWTYFDKGGWVLDVGAHGAYVEPAEGDGGFSHMRVTHTITWKMMRATFNYVQAIDDDLLVDAVDGGPYDIRNYGTIGAFYEF